MDQGFPEGVSIVIVTLNGEKRIGETIRHLLAQDVPDGIPWELIVVDNHSTDQTVELVRKLWTLPIPLKVVTETAQGVAYVRLRGIEEASFEFVLFVDDDNWLEPDWVSKVYTIFTTRPEIAMLGGSTSGEYEIPPPEWFDKVKESYAIGPQSGSTGDITDIRGYVWGAGMAFRKSIYQKIKRAGYQPLLSGRSVGKLVPGEDTEFCYAFIAAGGRIWYFEDLRLRHYIPGSRMNWDYVCRLSRGMGQTIFCFDLYRHSIRKSEYALSRIYFFSFAYWLWGLILLLLHPFRGKTGNLQYLAFLANSARAGVILKNFLRAPSLLRQVNTFISKLEQYQ
jgi:glycosyltransferase involved in cell wall biosynthesis